MKRADLPFSPPRGRRTIVTPILVVLLLSPFLIAANGGPGAPGGPGGPGGGGGDATVSGGTGITVTDNSGNGYHHWADASSSWVSGALNKSKGTYREGTPVPYRLVLTNLPDGPHTLVGEYQYANVQKNAWAFAGISGYGTRTADAPPCVDCTASVGSPEILGGTYLNLIEETIDDQYRQFTITFTTGTAGTVVVAWGGLLDVPHDGRLGPAGISGASYHMKLVSLDGSNLGSMDLQLQASALLAFDDPEPDGDGGCPDGTELSEDGTTCVTPPPTCEGSITATMVDGNGVARTGSITSGTPSVTLNGTATTDVDCGDYDYTAAAPQGWKLTNAATQTATVTHGEQTTLIWLVTEIITPDPDPDPAPDPDPDPAPDPDPDPAPDPDPDPDPAPDPDPDPAPDPDPDPDPAPDPDPDPAPDPDPDPDPVFDTDPDPDPDPVFDTDPVTDPVVEDDPATDGGSETCTGDLSVQVVDLVREAVPGAHVALDGQDHEVTTDGLAVTDLDCGTLEVELTSVPGGYVFVRTEIDGAATFTAQSTHESRKVTPTVSDEATTTVVFVIDPLEVMPEEITEPAPERDPLGAPVPTSDQQDPAPQPSPGEPAAEPTPEPTLPRTGIPAGRLLALAILMVTAGAAMLSSRRSVDR